MNPRKKFLKTAASEIFDVIVVGGGVHGAHMCREAALRGYSVLLLESRDYAFGTSSRSSKMLHGGVRYLEQGDFALVREALIERELICKTAPHLASPREFFFPVIKSKTRPSWQIRLGLSLYDGLSKWFRRGKEETSFPGHFVEPTSSPRATALKDLGLDFHSLLAYYDGQMDDARLVVEAIVDACSLGATAINYCSVTKAEKRAEEWHVHWQNKMSGEQVTSRCRYLLNAAGPWAPSFHEKIEPWNNSWPKPVYSRGIHLFFSKPWELPGLILPTGQPGRYYFVLPLFTAQGRCTMVGTTDNQVPANDEDPQPREEEIEQLLKYLKRDLPHAGLTKEKIYHTVCGMRILAEEKSWHPFASSKVSDVSRTEQWIELGNYSTFIGGKYTTARRTAFDALSKVDNYFGNDFSVLSGTSKDSTLRPLPGGRGFDEGVKSNLINSLTKALIERGGPPELVSVLAEAAVCRFGSRAAKLLEEDSINLAVSGSGWEELPALTSEIRMCVEEEQAVTVDDVMERRLSLNLLNISANQRVQFEKLIAEELTGD